MGRRLVRVAGWLLACAALAAIAFAIWLSFDLSERAEGRVANGRAVEAEVLSVRRRGFFPVSGMEFEVRYVVDGRAHVARLMPVSYGIVRDKDAPVRLFADASDPSRAATDDGFVSEGTLTLLPPVLIGFGLLGVIFGIGLAAQSETARVKPCDVLVDSNGRAWFVHIGFPVVFLGYDRTTVGRVLAEFVSAVDSADAARRAAVCALLRKSVFKTRLRGYDKSAVDDFVARGREELGSAG